MNSSSVHVEWPMVTLTSEICSHRFLKGRSYNSVAESRLSSSAVPSGGTWYSGSCRMSSFVKFTNTLDPHNQFYESYSAISVSPRLNRRSRRPADKSQSVAVGLSFFLERFSWFSRYDSFALQTGRARWGVHPIDSIAPGIRWSIASGN